MRASAMRTIAAPILILVSLLALVVGAAARGVGAADHLDAPSLGSLSAGAVKGDRDINDVYVFPAAGYRTVLAMTTHPAVNTPINAFKTYATNVRYTLNVDRNGDAVQDLAFVVTFGPANMTGDQTYTITRYNGINAVTQRHGKVRGTGSTAGNGTAGLKGSGKAFVGERSDPFFFDLIGFRGTLGLDTMTTERLCSTGPDPDPDQTGEDFFAMLNTMAIVLEVPDDQLGVKIGVWGDTRQLIGSRWTLIDQMGRPAINTVFNSGADKESFNVTPPSRQDDAGKPFRGNVAGVLQALGGYDAATANGLAAALIPDVITYDTASSSTNILNGRALADDVIDAELGIVTQGGIPSDCVAKHGDYLSSFPYLGNPH
jgi:hypothetical protein